MINRAKMPRQLRNKGGITSVVPRTNYLFGGIKKRIRKLIPNELASVAVKAAPIVAPFNPGAAALMRGIGRFDQRGSISDALKQGIGTFAFGKGVGMLGGAQSGEGFFGGQTFSKQGFSEGPIGRLFNRQAADSKVFGSDDALDGEMLTTGDKPSLLSKAGDFVTKSIKALPKGIEGQLIAGGLTAGASLLASYFQGEFEEPEPGESMEEYLARRREYVGTQMRTYMDNYFANDPEYMKLDDAGRDAFVARYNIRDGGRVGYQAGGITMANTLAENIRRNLANQAAFQKSLAPARERTRQKITQRLEDFGNKLTGIVEGARDYTIPVVQGARALLTGAGEPIITDSMRRDLIERAQAKGGDSGALGYEDYGLKPATKMGRFPGGITDIISDPQAFANAVTAGRVRYEKDPTAPGGYKFKDTKFDFDIKPEDTGLGANLLRGINEGGLKTAIPNVAKDLVQGAKNLLTPSTAMAAEPEVTTPTPDAGTVSQEGVIPGFKKVRNTKFYNADGTVKQKAVQDANFVAGMFPSEFYYVGPDGQEYGPETYGSIAAGMYPNIYDPRANKAKGGMPTGIMRSNKAGVMERDYRETGGFVPVGIKEKADDVPAMLSKNEFVFTADAVRGAGNGSIERGAQKMYDTMKRLEKRVV